MTLGEFMDKLLDMRAAVERDELPVENMRFLLVSSVFDISTKETVRLIRASDDEIRERFMEKLNQSIGIVNNEFAARWN